MSIVGFNLHVRYFVRHHFAGVNRPKEKKTVRMTKISDKVTEACYRVIKLAFQGRAFSEAESECTESCRAGA